MKYVLTLGMVGAFLLGLAAASQAEVYTADEASQSLTVLGMPVGQSPGQRIELPIVPHNVQYVAATHLLLVTGMMPQAGHHHTEVAPGALLAFDVRNLKAGPLWQMSVGQHPAHVVADPEGLFAYVTLTNEDRVAVIDLLQHKEVASIPTGEGPHGLRLTADGHFALVANMKAGSVSWLDLVRRQSVAQISTGGVPIQTAVSPDGKSGYVTLADSNQLAVLDMEKQAVERTLPLTYSPAQVYLSGSFVLVAQQGSRTMPGHLLSVFQSRNWNKQTDIKVGQGPHGVAADADGHYAYVTNVYDNSVSVIDLQMNNVSATVAVGSQPNGISISP